MALQTTERVVRWRGGGATDCRGGEVRQREEVRRRGDTSNGVRNHEKARGVGWGWERWTDVGCGMGWRVG